MRKYFVTAVLCAYTGARMLRACIACSVSTALGAFTGLYSSKARLLIEYAGGSIGGVANFCCGLFGMNLASWAL